MEINVTNLCEYKKDVMQGAIQILQEDERKCAENIGKSISPIITTIHISKEQRKLNYISGVDVNEPDITVLFARTNTAIRCYECDSYDDDISYDTNDFELWVKYNERLYYVLIRGIYRITGIIAECNEFTLTDLKYGCGCYRIGEIGINVYSYFTKEHLYAKVIPLANTVEKQEYISIVSTIFYNRIGQKKYNFEYNEYDLHHIHSIKELNNIHFNSITYISEDIPEYYYSRGYKETIKIIY